MTALSQLLATGFLMYCTSLAASAQTTLPQLAKPAETRQSEAAVQERLPPTALNPQPLVAPKIKMPLVVPRPPTVDAPALIRGRPAPAGGIDGAVARCEAVADVGLRTRCRDRVARESPVRPAS